MKIIFHAGFSEETESDMRKQKKEHQRCETEVKRKWRWQTGSRCETAGASSHLVGATGSQPLGTSIRMRKRTLENVCDWLDERAQPVAVR